MLNSSFFVGIPGLKPETGSIRTHFYMFGSRPTIPTLPIPKPGTEPDPIFTFKSGSRVWSFF